MTQFTSGPWEIEPVETRDGSIYIYPQWAPNVQDCVCIVQGGNETVDQANARLIAAAPELAQTLRAVADYWAGGDVPADLWEQMQAVLAKAGA